MKRWTRSLLVLLPAAVAFIGFVLFIYGDLTEKHWIRAGGAAISGAAVLMAVAGWWVIPVVATKRWPPSLDQVTEARK